MNRRFLCLLAVTACALQSFAAMLSPGTAGASAVIEIRTLAELQAMNNDRYADYVLMNDIDASETRTWNDGAGFVPIGNYSNSFSGNFDGGGHVIRNLYINRPGTTHVGLFGKINTRNPIANLGIDNATVIGGAEYVGILVGYALSGIVNCCTTGRVTGGQYVGGLVGETFKSITDCYSTATVIATGAAGGLAGWVFYGPITNCYSTGAVTGTSGVGGLVGYVTTSVSMTGCYSTGAVSGTYYVGGLVGVQQNTCSIATSYSTGAVTGTSDVGGLVGNNSGTVNPDCFWDTETSGKALSAGGTGKTTAAMMTPATFTDAGWDFTDTWCMIENLTYPLLQWASDAIVLQDDSYATAQDTALDVPALGVLENDNDTTGETPVAELVAQPAHGTLSLGDDGSFTYEPDSGYTGADSFVYHVVGGCDTATVTFTVDAPPTTTTTTVPPTTTTTTVPPQEGCSLKIIPDRMQSFLISRPQSGALPGREIAIDGDAALALLRIALFLSPMKAFTVVGGEGTVFDRSDALEWSPAGLRTMAALQVGPRLIAGLVFINPFVAQPGQYTLSIGDCTGTMTLEKL